MRSRIMIAFTLMLFGVSACLGDINLKQKQHTDGFEMMGQKQPAQDFTESIWFAKNKIASSNEKQGMILLIDKGIRYMINHENKTYAEMPMDMSKAIGASSEDAEEMKQFMGAMMQFKISITPTNEKQKIGQWKCTKYLQTIEMAMGKLTSELWATEDLSVDPEMYSQFISLSAAAMPGMESSMKEAAKEMKKIKGVIVRSISENTIMGQKIKSSSDLIEYNTGTAPASVFEIPKGYRKTSLENWRY